MGGARPDKSRTFSFSRNVASTSWGQDQTQLHPQPSGKVNGMPPGYVFVLPLCSRPRARKIQQTLKAKYKLDLHLKLLKNIYIKEINLKC